MGLLALAGLLLGCEPPAPPVAPAPAPPATEVPFSPEELSETLELSPLPLPPASPTNEVADRPEAAHLGQFLFFDPRLSGTGKVSCATCHDPAVGWTVATPLAEGVGTTNRNAPTLWNAAYLRWAFWDGRTDTLWSQCLQPIEAPGEMGSSRTRLVRLLQDDEALRAAYQAIFGPLPSLAADPLPADARPVADDPEHPHAQAWAALSEADRQAIDRVFSNLGKCIEAFERRIITRDAPFDRFVRGLRGEEPEGLKALSDSAQRGLKLFVGRGQCTLCHTGPNFSDGEFHNIGLSPGKDLPLDQGRFLGVPGVLADPFNGRGPFSADPEAEVNIKLRYLVQKPNNMAEFKTPTLRNVEQTAPYMHDGRFASLADVLDYYSLLDQVTAIGHREESLVELQLDDGELKDLEAFLRSLTGAPLDPALQQQPASPSAS